MLLFFHWHSIFRLICPLFFPIFSLKITIVFSEELCSLIDDFTFQVYCKPRSDHKMPYRQLFE